MKTTYLTTLSKRRHKFGFTLVELLVVMFIIAALASIGAGVFFKLRGSAKEKETTIFMKSIATNMETVKLETGVPYPISTGDTDDLLKYLTGNDNYFSLVDPDNTYNVKPAMVDLLPEGSQSKFVDGDAVENSWTSGKLIDSWQQDITYINNGSLVGGDINNFEGGFDLKSTGKDFEDNNANTKDDIEM